MMSLILNNGVVMPALGFGVFQTPPEETIEAVETALRVGLPPHRHRRRVRQRARGRRGASVAPASTATTSSSRPRSGSATTATTPPCTPSTRAPASSASTRSTCSSCTRRCRARFDLTIDAYRALEKLLEDGRVRAIGVSNFMPGHLDELLTERPRSCRRSTRSRCTRTSRSRRCSAADAEHGILTQAWSPIGGITFYRDGRARQHARRRDHRRHRQGARQDARRR